MIQRSAQSRSRRGCPPVTSGGLAQRRTLRRSGPWCGRTPGQTWCESLETVCDSSQGSAPLLDGESVVSLQIGDDSVQFRRFGWRQGTPQPAHALHGNLVRGASIAAIAPFATQQFNGCFDALPRVAGIRGSTVWAGVVLAHSSSRIRGERQTGKFSYYRRSNHIGAIWPGCPSRGNVEGRAKVFALPRGSCPGSSWCRVLMEPTLTAQIVEESHSGRQV